MKQLKKILVLVSVSILCISLQAQNLSESETVRYIQNTFNNYEVFVTEGDIYFGVNDCDKKLIKYNNPILTIECSKYAKTIAVSFNVNDVYFETGEEKGWDMLFIKGKANISYNGKLTSKVNLHWREQIVATRLKNAFEHLQDISGKGKSAPDPFDDKPSTQSSISRIESQNTKAFTYRGSIGAFSISYPIGWEVKENPQERVRVLISAPTSSGSNFRTNVNVISSKNYDSLEKLFQIHQQAYNNNRNIFVGYQLESKENVTINGISGTKVTSSYGLNNVKVKGIQYILKKADNTMYTITFTIGLSYYERDMRFVENIIQSFKSL